MGATSQRRCKTQCGLTIHIVRTDQPVPDMFKIRPEKLPVWHQKYSKLSIRYHQSNHNMSNATHYTALGLAQTAAPEVIRAAYRALSLICHPDKTLHLAAGERVSRAAVFNEVQAAYDVLGNPTLKAAYDADLARQNNKTEKPSYPQSSVRTASEPSSKPKRRMIVRITTPEEKAAMQAKVHQSLDYLRQQRIERDSEDVNLDISGLKGWARTWEKLAEDNRTDPAMYAHCVIRVYEYEQKIADREQQHKESLVNMSTAKQERPTAAVKQRQSTEGAPKRPIKSSLRAFMYSDNASCVNSEYATATSTTTTAAFRGSARAEERKRAENDHAVELTARAQARTAEKTDVKHLSKRI